MGACGAGGARILVVERRADAGAGVVWRGGVEPGNIVAFAVDPDLLRPVLDADSVNYDVARDPSPFAAGMVMRRGAFGDRHC